MDRLAGYLLKADKAREFVRLVGGEEEGIEGNRLEWSINTWVYRQKPSARICKVAFVPAHEDGPGEDGYVFITRLVGFHPKAPIPTLSEGEEDRKAKQVIEGIMASSAALKGVDLSWVEFTDSFGIGLDGYRARDARAPKITVTHGSLEDWLAEHERKGGRALAKARS